MKSLKQIVRDGDAISYMNALAGATQTIMPSKDGSEENRCDFALVVTDGRFVEFVGSVGTVKDLTGLLEEALKRLKAGQVKVKIVTTGEDGHEECD